MSKNLTKRSEDYSKWYNELVGKADLAENSGVRGCMLETQNLKVRSITETV